MLISCNNELNNYDVVFFLALKLVFILANSSDRVLFSWFYQGVIGLQNTKDLIHEVFLCSFDYLCPIKTIAVPFTSYNSHMFQKCMAIRRYSFWKSTQIKYDDIVADIYWEELET